MKLALKFVFYAALIVLMTIATIVIFKNHPEVQLAFLIPGVFILVYSKITDDIYISDSVRLRAVRGR